MIQLIYTSAATVEFSREDLIELLDRARQNNEGLEVSGMLVYQDGSFLQILEGEEEKVIPLYEKIEKDPRHGEVKLILRSEIEERSFGDWKMGFYDATRQAARKVPGYFDFFRAGPPFSKSEIDRARKVLLQFREGAWRQQVEIEARAPDPVSGS